MDTNSPSDRKDAIVILGMHRSGTSAMARVLSLVGAGLPKNLLGAGAGNLKGHWEPVDVQVLNDEILRDLDSSWHDVFGPLAGSNRKLPAERYVGRAAEIIRSNWRQASPIVLKEPRTAVLLDVWVKALESEGYRIGFVIMIRHPLEVAASLRDVHRRNKNESLLLWSTYMLASEVGTRKYPRAFVKFDDLLVDPTAVLDKVESTLDIHLPRRTWAASSEIEEFISSEDRHHVAKSDKGLKHFPSVERYFNFLSDAAAGAPWNVDASTDLSEWLTSLSQVVGPVLGRVERDLGTTELTLEQERAGRAEAEAAAASRVAELQQNLTEAQGAFELAALEAARNRSEWEREEAAQARTLSDLAIEAEGLRGEIDGLRERSEQAEQSLRAELTVADTDAGMLHDRLSAAEAHAEALGSELAQRAQLDQALRAQLTDAETEATALREHVGAAERRAEALGGELESARAQALQLEQSLGAQLKGAVERIATSQRELDDARSRIVLTEQSLRAELDQSRRVAQAELQLVRDGAADSAKLASQRLANAQALAEMEASSLQSELEFEKTQTAAALRQVRLDLDVLRNEADAERVVAAALKQEASALRSQETETQRLLAEESAARLTEAEKITVMRSELEELNAESQRFRAGLAAAEEAAAGKTAEYEHLRSYVQTLESGLATIYRTRTFRIKTAILKMWRSVLPRRTD